MTLRNFFTGRAIGFLLLVIIGFGFFAYETYAPVSDSDLIPEEQRTDQDPDAGAPTFSWRYEQADSLNPDGNPRTNVYIDARYGDRSVQGKLIDTVDSGCGDLDQSEADSVPRSTVAQCYGAGLGYVYKVTKGGSAYLVQRKEFEEASPEYDPPVRQYEVIAEFPLSIQR